MAIPREVRRQGREADRYTSIGAKVKSDEAYRQFPLCLHATRIRYSRTGTTDEQDGEDIDSVMILICM
jgi:hypothetical protein